MLARSCVGSASVRLDGGGILMSLETLRDFLGFSSKAIVEVGRSWQTGTARVYPLRLCACNASADKVPCLVGGILCFEAPQCSIGALG